ncbi:uncharacterized protein N7479_009565 [Penicillium vulpinum]|uniref:Uncharacterized protein n=1 Tax=Penicillium vulpinum TaxID=29845 RepID=A0A1V6RYH2_9EURO|nr:uncharacterized protein N7479_009565 [Penicillium vulpinum]KAJ5951152.1 hypothetical protein N7479_009565 [Penicillium vulpinum]OQE06842.1 hypothetical protein PENVUL_c016G08665 [Penicillium vulpinum]
MFGRFSRKAVVAKPSIDTDESWDADDEDSGSDPAPNTFNLMPMSKVLGLKPSKDVTPPLFRFRVRREEDKFLGASSSCDGWINISHFLWTMCATLADTGTDREWTAAFEKWRPQWKKVRAQVKTYGFTQFSSEIALAPVDLVLVQFFGSQLDGGVRGFEIEQEDPNTPSDTQDVWALWRYIIETPAGQIKEFNVTLRDTARLMRS